MDQQQRFITFFLLSMAGMYLWINVGLPFFHPEMIRDKAAQQIANSESGSSDPAVSSEVSSSSISKKPSDADADPATVETTDTSTQVELADFPESKVTLGSLDPQSPYYLQAVITSRGAAVESLQLNDPRYRELTDRSKALLLAGTLEGTSRSSFDLRTSVIDRFLSKEGESLETVNWKVVDGSQTEKSVTFEYPAPDGSFKIRKVYELEEGKSGERETYNQGYELRLKIEFVNLSDQATEFKYALQGPVGYRPENLENTRRFLSIQAGFLNGGSVRHEQVLSTEISKQADTEQGIENFKAPLKYLGVDGQYFATLLLPGGDQEATNWIETAQPLLVQRGSKPEHSQISFLLESNPVTVLPKQTVAHDYTLYAGPKRTSLLRPYDADSIIEYGWFGWISKIMLGLLNFFHTTLWVPYGFAIVMLTVTVRALMFPISLKHAKAAKRMKDMQPKFEEIKKKYENDKEKLARAQMELMKESGFFSGCLPMLLQIPIFIGLYQALYVSVDLRMAQFLWIDNLAAPDQLFRLPFSIPWLGYDFNLLPIVTVGLFILQQKLFSPPPANEEQAMQQKMMGYMMIFIGFMFYKVPAGLCIYFIASSTWAIAERKLLDWKGPNAKDAEDKPAEPPVVKAKPKAEENPPEKKGGWLRDTMSALDAAANPDAKKPGKSGSKKQNKKGKPKR